MKWKIGYIDGSFDIFHSGHANILHRAASMCDILYVGVASDQIHHEKKGAPMQPYEVRADVISRLDCVRAVITHNAFDEIDYDDLGINVRFVGTDHGSWGVEQVKGLMWCIRNGVAIIHIPYTEGICSTEIKEGLRELS